MPWTPANYRARAKSRNRAYYQFLWDLDSLQSDIAELTAEDVDWNDHTISYRRNKTDVPVVITFGAEAKSLLQALLKSDQLFPRMVFRVFHEECKF